MELRLWLLSLQQPTFLQEKSFLDSPTCLYSQAKEKGAIVNLGSKEYPSSWHAQRQQNPPPEHGREQGLTVLHYSIIRGQIRRAGQGTAPALGRFSSFGKAYPGSASLAAVF